MLWELQQFLERGNVAIKRNQPLMFHELSFQGWDERLRGDLNTQSAPERSENSHQTREYMKSSPFPPFFLKYHIKGKSTNSKSTALKKAGRGPSRPFPNTTLPPKVTPRLTFNTIFMRSFFLFNV